MPSDYSPREKFGKIKSGTKFLLFGQGSDNEGNPYTRFINGNVYLKLAATDFDQKIEGVFEFKFKYNAVNLLTGKLISVSDNDVVQTVVI